MHADPHAVAARADERADLHADRKVAAIAAGQHAMVHIRQLTTAGLGRGAIAHRVARGRLTRIHTGVYLVGPVVPPLGWEMAAVLAGGAGSVLSHEAALAVWKLHGDIGTAMHITVAGRQRARIPGISVHRASSLERRDIRRHRRILLTAPARTLLDVAATLGLRELERAVDDARGRRLVRDRDLVDVLTRHPRRRGVARIRELLESAPALTRSEAEAVLLDLLRRAGIAPRRVNGRVGRYEVDMLWPRERLIVEVDGFAYHASRAAFERDRLRDAQLSAAGYRVIRVTWRQILDEPEAVVARIAQALVRGIRQ